MIILAKFIHLGLMDNCIGGLNSYRVTPLYPAYGSAFQERLSRLYLLVRTT